MRTVFAAKNPACSGSRHMRIAGDQLQGRGDKSRKRRLSCARQLAAEATAASRFEGRGVGWEGERREIPAEGR